MQYRYRYLPSNGAYQLQLRWRGQWECCGIMGLSAMLMLASGAGNTLEPY